MRREEEFEFKTEEEAQRWADGALCALNFSFDDETDIEQYVRNDDEGHSVWGVRLVRDDRTY